MDFHKVNFQSSIVPPSDDQFFAYFQAAYRGEPLTSEDAEGAMRLILQGAVSPVRLAAFLTAIPPYKATVDLLVGFARAMRAAMIRVDAGGGPSLDTCGTGGDGLNTFNISTVAAFVVAGCGLKVAKHGNRSASSLCGSADVLEAMGVQVEISPEKMGACIREEGIGFLFARLLHPAMRHAAPVRSELRVRTVLNLMGPLCNPASATAQLIGVPDEHLGDLMAGALAVLGQGEQYLVHGSDGLDEITTTGSTTVWKVRSGGVHKEVWQPGDFGLRRASIEDLRGGDKDVNAGIGLEILRREPGPRRDVVLLNAAGGLLVAGDCADASEAMKKAAWSIDSGGALRKLERLRAASNRLI
ncbi:MAG: anthranilate phosphoribosyltransferase [Acidobacteria bacterium]|nr:anthranilate phosphoribosyltransferase [Acidobacteriota bacterium]